MRCWVTYLLSVYLITASGCAHFAKIPMWRSAGVPVDGVKTVAVLPFEGEWGSRVAEEVSDAFADSGAYTIVSADSLPEIQTADRDGEVPTFDQVLVAARQADIDAVLTGTIVNDGALEAEQRVRTGILRKDLKPSRSMTVDYKLVDTRTGETLSQNRISCLEPEQKKSEQQLEQTLIQRCGLEVVSQLTPQCSDCSIALANCAWTERGGIAVRKGVRAAESGNWQSAVEAWESALRVNPVNDAAIFNLALAAASRSEFKKAEELALSALRIQHSECYEKGLAKIRQQRSQFESVSRHLGDLKQSTAELTAR